MSAPPHIATRTDAQRVPADQQRRDIEITHLRERFGEECDRVRDLTSKVKRLEHTIRTFLSAKTLTAGQRHELVALLAGLQDGASPDPRVAGISVAERNLIEAFRVMRGSNKRVMTILGKQLAALERRSAKKPKRGT